MHDEIGGLFITNDVLNEKCEKILCIYTTSECIGASEGRIE